MSRIEDILEKHPRPWTQGKDGDTVLDADGQVIVDLYIDPVFLIEMIINLSNREWLGDMIKEPKFVFMISLDIKENGKFILCMVRDGKEGYHETNYRWDFTEETARKKCRELNDAMGISESEEHRIIIDSMRGKSVGEMARAIY